MRSLGDIGGPSLLLREPLSSFQNLKPMSWFEQLMLGRFFRHERLHYGPPQRWLDRTWELRLGSVKGAVYKVGVEIKTKDREDAVSLSRDVYAAIEEILGAPSQLEPGIFAWDADDGNVVLQLTNVRRDRRVMVFFTSSIARSFLVRRQDR